ncbi:hypothetical protein Val02_70480 [Virgisporangium aliadipatigenens]|uniref:Tetratricopeptide repeat protein n=1 Tax=Virgisporangium aliadipatigenens TaxID=741659 RepID=A0A8J3YT68_9ACTN|nr:tetratricopeptide repeat protein [Virgisporangium aliadipatigenens]GIJ50162.1 hypothetical protein Val02_70480 [Virgisporangium aliadipatigenens]
MSVPDEAGSLRLEAEGEVALAVLALDDGEIGHAAGHAANALGCDPTLPEAHEVLARVAAAAGDGALDLYPLDGQVYIGNVVARAHLLAAAGDLDQALGLLVAATRHDPATAWASAAWLDRDGVAAQIPPDNLAAHFMRLCSGLSDPIDRDTRPALAPYLRLARDAVRAHPRDGRLLGAASAFARRMGSPAEAIRWARRATELEPGLLSSIWLGYAYRTAGLVDEAVAAWEGSLAYEPKNCAVMTDIAELLANNDRLPEALAWIERAAAINPRDPSAFPTACALRYLDSGDVHHLVRLADHVRDHPGEAHAEGMLTGTCRKRDWLGGVPGTDTTWAHPVAAYDDALARPGTGRVWESLGLLHHRADEPWESSTRRGELVARLSDPDAETRECALFALIVAAWVEPAVRADVAALVRHHADAPAALVRITPSA